MANFAIRLTTFTLFFIISCNIGKNQGVLDPFFEGKVSNVQEFSPSKVIELAISCKNIDLKSMDNTSVEVLREKGIDLNNKIIYYDISKTKISSSEVAKLEVYLNREVDCLQIINPKASLCHFTESKASFESLVFLTWTLQEIGPLCLSKDIFDNFTEARNYYNTNLKHRDGYE